MRLTVMMCIVLLLFSKHFFGHR